MTLLGAADGSPLKCGKSTVDSHLDVCLYGSSITRVISGQRVLCQGRNKEAQQIRTKRTKTTETKHELNE